MRTTKGGDFINESEIDFEPLQVISADNDLSNLPAQTGVFTPKTGYFTIPIGASTLTTKTLIQALAGNGNLVQYFEANNGNTYRRAKIGGSWSAWSILNVTRTSQLINDSSFAALGDAGNSLTLGPWTIWADGSTLRIRHSSVSGDVMTLNTSKLLNLP